MGSNTWRGALSEPQKQDKLILDPEMQEASYMGITMFNNSLKLFLLLQLSINNLDFVQRYSCCFFYFFWCQIICNAKKSIYELLFLLTLLGYSLSVGERNGSPLYFTGAPRFDHVGQVIVFQPDDDKWNTTQRITGDQVIYHLNDAMLLPLKLVSKNILLGILRKSE